MIKQAESFTRLFHEASRHHRLGNEVEACRQVTLALADEPGLTRRLPVLTSYDELYAKVPALAAQIQTPKRAASLSGFLTLVGRGDLAAMLLIRTAELTPRAANQDPIRADQVLAQAQAFARAGDHAAAAERVELLLALDNSPVDPLLAAIGPMMASQDPAIVLGLANMLLGCGMHWAAELLFARHLSLAADAQDHAGTLDGLDRLDAARLLDLAIAQQLASRTEMADRLLRRALSHDPGPERVRLDALGPDLVAVAAITKILAGVRHPSTADGLLTLCELREVTASVALCKAWLDAHEAAPAPA